MSLPQIAQHLEAHGRGEDTHLVHMTTGELKALQKMAEKHGGSLTINPSTGLPEAGFLSAILPVALGAAGAAFGVDPMLMAALAGGADYAITGSLSQGLSAGLGAWGGASLESGISGMGATDIVNQGGNLAEAQYNDQVKQLMDLNQGPVNPTDLTQTAQTQIANTPGLTPDQTSALNTSALYNPSGAAQSAGMLQANAAATPTSTLQAGLQSGNLMNYAGSHLGQVAAAGLPILAGAASSMNKPIPAATTANNTNPMGLNTIPRDANGNPIFSASIPTPPSPAYQPVYPNYVAHPYTAADGGLMSVSKYAGQDGSLTTSDYGTILSGLGALETKTPSDTQKAIADAQKQASANGVYQLSDTEYNKLTPDQVMKRAHITVAKGIQPVGQLGAISVDPAIVAQQDIANQAAQQTSAKEGGLMKHTHRYDGGGEVDLHGTVRTTGGQNSAQGAQGYTPPGGQPYGPAAYSQGGNWGNAMPFQPQNGLMLGGLGAYQGQQGGPISSPSITLPAPTGGVVGMATGGSAPSKAASCSQFGNQSLVNLYQNVLGRAPDQAGYNYWNNAMKNGATINDISKFFVTSPEYQQMGSIQRSPEALQQANAAYTSARYIPQPTRPTPTGSAGYAIDPTKMQGSPAYQQAQAAQAAQQAAQQQQQAQQEADQQNNYASAGASGGLPKDFKHRHIQDGHLGSYSDGGRLLKGPGDGVSDGIPATIGGKQPARLADGEFVIPARIVSELGNGSTDAGAKRLYAMMDRIKSARKKAKDIAADTKAYKYLPA